jgi:hypothetical protein
MDNLEQYILDLDFMKGSSNNSWQDMFGQGFNQWNACHRILPNLPLHSRQGPHAFTVYNEAAKLKWSQLKGSDWPSFEMADSISTLPTVIQKEIKEQFELTALKQTFNIDAVTYNFLNTHITAYKETTNQISSLVKHGLLVTGVPIKLQSFKEKQMLINNFHQCVDWYNEWAVANNYALMSMSDVVNQADNEELAFDAHLTTRLTNSVAVTKS